METQIIEPTQELEAPQCKHHWVIETPNGAISQGRCKLCSEIREFRNSAADTMWEGDPMRSISKMGGSRSMVREKVAPALED